jgi:CDP-glucose 4,6-dehydratase
MVTPAPSFWAGKRVLLTGHTGFKGSWATLWLERLGAEVHGLSLAPITTPSLWELVDRPGVTNGFVDVRDSEAVKIAFAEARPDIVIHMAAQALVHPSYDDPDTTFDTNVMGLVRILDCARTSPSVRAVVNVTSDKCYENREQLWPYREDEPMGGSDPYSASKGCAELVTSAYRRSFFNQPGGARLASGRAGNVIGGGDWSQDRLVPDCLEAFATGRPVMIRNPMSTRPWQHVLEPVCGYLVLAQALYERGDDVAEGWNFGPTDEDAWPVQRIVDRLIGTWGEGAAWVGDPTVRPHEAMLLRVDATKARVRLGWRPRLPLEDALEWTVSWSKSLASGQSARTITMEQIERFETLMPR